MLKYIRYYNDSIALGASSTLRFRDNRGQELVKTLEAILGVRVGDILELRVLEGSESTHGLQDGTVLGSLRCGSCSLGLGDGHRARDAGDGRGGRGGRGLDGLDGHLVGGDTLRDGVALVAGAAEGGRADDESAEAYEDGGDDTAKRGEAVLSAVGVGGRVGIVLVLV